MNVIKLSSPATEEFWEIPVLFEDEHLLALDKPAGLLSTPDHDNPGRPSLMKLLHTAIADKKAWTIERNLGYLSDAHRLDPDASGVLLLAKNKSALIALADLFGTDKPSRQYITLAHGSPVEDSFSINAKLAPHPLKPGQTRVDPHNGKQAQTRVEVMERYQRQTLLRCRPLADRKHQIRVHLCNVGLRIVGDELYGGKPLWLSNLKKDYRLKPGREERPLLARAALHAENLALRHPVTGGNITITAEWPKDLRVAVKYLRQYAA